MKFGIKFAIVTGLQVLCLVGMIGYRYHSLERGAIIVLEAPRPKDPRSLFMGDYVIIRYTINHLNLKEIPNDLNNLKNDSPVYVELEQRGAVWAPVRASITKPRGKNIFLKGKVTDYETQGKIYLSFSPEQISALEKRVRIFEESNEPKRTMKIDITPLKELDLAGLTTPIGPGESRFQPGSKVYVSLFYTGATLRPTGVTTERPNEYLTFLFIEGTIVTFSSYKTIDVKYGIENYFVPEGAGHDVERKLREVQKARVSVDPEGNGTVIGIPDN